MNTPEDNWDNEKLRRKIDQAWEMAGLARQDDDKIDELKQTEEARRLQTILAERLRQ